jgi:hypothetical protein
MLRFYGFLREKIGVVECGFYWGYLRVVCVCCGENVVKLWWMRGKRGARDVIFLWC